jgi:excisionase family DNA binding protein
VSCELFNEYPDIVDVDQLCSMLKIGKNTAYKLLKSEKIKSIRIGRTHKILKSSVISYLVKESA